jgi:type IV pilus assembly protein PilB
VAQKLLQLLQSTDLKDIVNLSTGDLAGNQDMDCDCTIAMLGKNENPDDYIKDVASLKEVCNVPVVISLIDKKQEEDISGTGLVSDETIFTPVNPARLTAIIKEHLPAPVSDMSGGQAGNGGSMQEALISKGIVTSQQLQKALKYQKSPGNYALLETLVQLGYMENKTRVQLLKEQINVNSATPRQFASAELDIVTIIPENIARQHTCIALEKHGSGLTVALIDPLNLQLVDFLRDQTNMTINPVLGTAEEIKNAINRLYSNIAAHKDASETAASLSDNILARASEGRGAASSAGVEAEVVKLLNLIIGNAVRDKATDIHIEPAEKESIIRYRINGELRRVLSPPKFTHHAVINRIKILSNLNVEERRLPQEGRTTVKLQNMEVDARVSLLPTLYGEKAVISILDNEALDNSIESLGLSENDLSLLMKHLSVPYGMVLVTGPAGCGKSTTMYAAAQEIAGESKNVITIEDPIESQFEGITQVQIVPGIGFSMVSALRAAQRQDPDAILISEIKDEELAEIAVKTALTGQLILSSMVTKDAVSGISQLVDIGVSPLLLGSALNLIISQRLVRKICPKCKIPFEPSAELIDSLQIKDLHGKRFYQGEGCVQCNGSGFLGNAGVFELLTVSQDIRKLIFRNASSSEIRQQAEKSGFKPLSKAVVDLALQGITSLEQAISIVSE